MQSNGARAAVGVAALAAIVVAFFLFSGGDDDSSDSGETTVTTSAGTTTTEVVAKPEKIVLADGEPVDGAADLTYENGDTVEIVVQSDAETEIHLHGYDIEEEATPEKPAEFKFTADLEGKFEMEDHHTEALIAELTVNP